MIYKNEDLLTIPGVKGAPINGVEIKKINKIPDERGAIFHMLRSDEEMFEKFGEIYFSKIYKDVIKAWHIHSEMKLNYSVVYGMVKMVLFDDRKDSRTKGNIMEIFLGDENYMLVKVPQNVWNGFKGYGTDFSIVANCATIAHKKSEISRLDPFSDTIPYDWNLQHG